MKNLLKILLLLLLPLFVVAQIKETKEVLICEPIIYSLNGDTAYCAGSAGVSISLDSSQTGISYQLYKDGMAKGSPVAGTSNSLIWNNLLAGAYTVTATNDTNQTCIALMNGSIHVVENPLPIVDAGYDQYAYCGYFATLNATASGGSGSYAYHWEPAAYVVNPDTHTTTTVSLGGPIRYIVLVTDSVNLCIQTDTVYVIAMCSFGVEAQVQPNNVCSGDTVF